MKKTAAVFIAVMLLFTLFPHAYARTEQDRGIAFVLPASLQYVDAEAFAGTPVKTVVFRNGLLRISEEAFAGSKNLKDIYIPPSVAYIADSAIPSNRGLVVHGEKDSYAQAWAQFHSFCFAEETMWKTAHEHKVKVLNRYSGANWALQSEEAEKQRIRGETNRSVRSMRPQDRPELNPIDYRFP